MTPITNLAASTNCFPLRNGLGSAYEDLSGRYLTAYKAVFGTHARNMEYRDYIASTTLSSDEVLGDWRWLIGPGLQLWLVTKVGDALLRDSADGSIHFLDTISGKVERVARNEAEFELAVAVEENATKWLMPDIVKGQELLGMRPGPNECLSFKIPPVLGGQLDPDNFETCSIPAHFSIAGQIHRQVKNLPPGTKITDINIEAPGGVAKKRPWWRFW